MPLLDSWTLDLQVDDILWGQGADPQQVRASFPHLVRVAEEALLGGRPLLRPATLHRRLAVREQRGHRLVLEEGTALAGPFVAQFLSGVDQVAVALCTIGGDLEARARALARQRPALALALDGLGSAAVEALAEQVCALLSQEAAAVGLETTSPLYPGMSGWPLEEGQRALLSLLDGATIGVRMQPGGLLVPLKSISLLLGWGKEVSRGGSACERCDLRGRCRYRRNDP